jgi:hypothetical protein
MRLLLAFLTGAIAGTALDRIHTYWGVTVQPDPLLWGESWWVPLVFGGAGILVIYTPRWIRRALHAPAAPGSTANLLAAFAWFTAVYFASGIWKDHPVCLLAAFTATWVARGFVRRSAVFWLIGVAAAILGPATEHLMTQVLHWYTFPDGHVLGLPLWLPGLYLHAAAFGDAVDRRWPKPFIQDKSVA